jgi:hypothetical protein
MMRAAWPVAHADDSLDCQVDSAVFAMYGLTDEEIKIMKTCN